MIRVGDRVRYSSEFLRNIGWVRNDIPQMRGTVMHIRDLASCRLATVLWEGEVHTRSVNVNNLEKVQ